MSTIYLEESAALEPDAADRLAHLVESGHDIVLVARAAPPAAVEHLAVRLIPALPDSPPRGSWFVTADPGACGDRQAGLRTILIGPRDDVPRPTRCDTTARDLREAVLEILAADTMPA